MKSWAVSLAAHGVVLGLAAALWPEAEPEAEAEPFRWEVAFAAAPPVAPAVKPVVKPVAPPEPPPFPRAVPRPVAEPRPAPMPQRPLQSSPPPAPQPEPVSPSQESPEPAPTAAAVPAPAQVVARGADPSPSPPRSEPAPPPAKPMADPVAMEKRWQAALLGRLRAQKRYPPVARRLGQEGVVVLRVVVAPDGRLESVQVQQGSGYPILDRDALRLLEEAATAVRDEMTGGDGQAQQSLRLAIPIAYRLEG